MSFQHPKDLFFSPSLIFINCFKTQKVMELFSKMYLLKQEESKMGENPL